MEKESLISVIMPVRNGSNYIREALDSLARQGMEMEVIVVDDGSEDDTASIAAGAGCRVLSHPVSLGPVRAKNTGLAAAKGAFILFLDHDDRLRDGALRTLMDAVAADPQAMAVEAKVQDFLSPDAGPMPGTLVRPEPYYGLFTGAILIRREAFDRIGPFPEQLQAGEIIDWFSRMEQHQLKVRKIDAVTADRRIHRTNFGKTHASVEMKDYAAILRARLQRKARG